MKRSTLFLALAFFSCVSALQAAPIPPGAPELQVFLASLKAKQPSQRSPCTVSLVCNGLPNSYTISCSGSNSCTSGADYVDCDNGTVHKTCPICEAQCPCPGDIYCFGWSSCDDGLRRITCDGHIHSCIPPTGC